MCRQYVLSRATLGATSGTTVTCHFQQSSWIPIVFSVSKILVIDVTVVPDVVPDVVLLKIYCLHIIPSCPHDPRRFQLCSFPKDSSFWCHCGSWCDSWYADEIGHLRQCRWHLQMTYMPADNVPMTCIPVDDMCMTPGVVLHEIGQLRQVRMMCRWHLDVICTWCRWHADNIWMSSAHGVDDMWMTCGQHLDVICTWCGQHADNVWMTSVKSHPKSHSRVIRASSAYRLHIICTLSARDFSPQTIFSQRAENSSAKNEGERDIASKGCKKNLLENEYGNQFFKSHFWELSALTYRWENVFVMVTVRMVCTHPNTNAQVRKCTHDGDSEDGIINLIFGRVIL